MVLKRLLAIIAIITLSSTQLMAAQQKKSRIPPMETYQAMLAGSKEQGWISFRNIDGKQIVYFTPLQNLKCRLKEIRYSINSKELDQQFPLAKCNPQNPFALPPDAPLEVLWLPMKPGTAKTVAVQVVWEDGTESEIAVYEPCEDVGDQTCAWPLE